MTTQTLVEHLNAKRSGQCWMARCPAHDDRNPSLSITEKNGKVLVKCHAGCSQQDVIAALTELGVWEPRSTHSKDDLGEEIAVYDYTDERGDLLYQIVRYEPKNKPKTFRPRYLGRNGECVWKKHPRQILYHLPEVLESPIVFVVEGEKDVETLRAHGFVATTNAGGASQPWLDNYTQALAGREVILVPDNDQTGVAHMKKIARALLGRVAQLMVLNDIYEPGVKDITDWFNHGHSECELISILEEVHAH